MLQTTALLTVAALLTLATGCEPASNSSEPVNDANEANTASEQDLEDGGYVPSPHREVASEHFATLTRAQTVEQEREAVTAFAAWLNEHGYKLQIETLDDGAHRLACPYFPPVTPWADHTFLDPAHLDLLPRYDNP